MRASQMFPSRFLKSVDLVNPETEEFREANLTIESFAIEEVGQDGDQKPVLHFTETKKALTLNKTNLTTLANNIGDETDNWPGQRVTLYVTQDTYGGQTYDVVRVKAKPKGVAARTAAVAESARPAKPAPAKGTFDPDEIPF